MAREDINMKESIDLLLNLIAAFCVIGYIFGVITVLAIVYIRKLIKDE
jgi:hypothetical protein